MRFTLAFIFSALVLPYSVQAHAADPGTYRPGKAYLSLTAPNANLCAAQCNGDAQCKGWNFIRVKQDAATGLCEFNSQHVAPVASAVSISGDNNSTRSSVRLIPAGTRTVKVGMPSVTPPVASHPPRRQTRTQPTPAQTPRRIVRKVEPVQPKQSATPAHYRRQIPSSKPVQPQAVSSRPAFRHSLDTASHAPARIPPTTETDVVSTMQRRRLEAMIKRAQAPVQQPAVPDPNRSKPAPSLPGQSGSAIPLRQPQAQFPAGMSAEQVQQSLFGSLYDDVSTPKSLNIDDIPADQNAPIATVTSVPTKKIDVENLMAGASNGH